MSLDTIDKTIIECLQEDGRMSSADIARRLGNVSVRSVRYRLERLVDQGFIQVSAIANPRMLGYTVVADVFIQVEPGQVMAVATQISSFENVSYVACSTGESDISVQIVAHDNVELYSFVTEVIGKIHGVRQTTTSIVPIILKDVYRWRIPSNLKDGDRKQENSAGDE